ncbi:MAG: hypothetical protein HFH80_06990 [Lachnospiraceae bacterium]|nr:hypothetical protein [Lachnospiraceae bacterium]
MFGALEQKKQWGMDMAISICRRFVMHNDFVPPTENIHEWDYLAFGYIDGISVKNDIFRDKAWNLNFIWEENVATRKELMEPESRQVIYGFRSEESQETNKEETFWSNRGKDTNYPFAFFVMIQFEDEGKKNLSLLMENRRCLEERFNIKGKVKGITYLTLEDSDLLLVLRCNDYDDGAGLINEIHQGCPFFKYQDEATWYVKYSFTIPAVDKCFMNMPKSVVMLKDQKVHNAYVYATELCSGSIGGLYNILKHSLSTYIKGKQAVLGYNDELILFSEIPWDKFVDLYKDKTGILNHSNEEFQQYVSSVTTIIGLNQNEVQGNQLSISPSRQNKELLRIRNSFFDFLKSRLDALEASSPQNEMCKNIILSLRYLINSLSKFEGSHASENLFMPSVFAIHIFIEILLEMFQAESNLVELECYQDYSRFLNGLRSYAQNPVRSDRQFTQAVELNIRTYNLPVKLNVFYNAFIFCVRNFLNESLKHDYEFLTCPGVSSNMKVEELFIGQSEDKRLFLVNIPENQAYHLKLMMIMLCHEIGHFVGSNIRRRDDRKECLIKALARMIALFYQSNIECLSGECFNDFWRTFEEKLSEDIEKNYILYYEPEYVKEQYIKPDIMSEERYNAYIEEIAKIKKRLGNHSLIVEEAILDAAVCIIRKNQEIYFGESLYDSYMIDYGKYHDKARAEKKRNELLKEIHYYSMDILKIRTAQRNIVNVESMINILISICKEGLSDVIAIMTLELNQEQYAMALIENACEQGGEEELLTETINEVSVRAALVTACMLMRREDKALGYGWECRWRLSETANDSVAKFYSKITEFIEQFINNDTGATMEKRSEKSHICNYLCDRKLLKYILSYLLKCREAYAAIIQQKEQEQKEIKAAFAIAQSDTIEAAMLSIQSLIDHYRERIHQKMVRAVEC